MGYRIESQGGHVIDDDNDTAIVYRDGIELPVAVFYGSGRTAEAQAWLQSKLLQPQPTGPSVRCRIAVATGAAGWWCAYGQGSTASPTSDEDAIRDLEDEFGKLNREDSVAWVEADVPLPQRVEPVVIQGTVVTGESDASAS